jgi:hypothetical protein
MSEPIKLRAGRRYLISDGKSWNPDFIEIKVLEMSPGGFVKFQYCFEDGGTVWKKADELNVREDLDTTKNCLPQ